MGPARTLGYFLREALSNLARSWRVNLLATLTIAVSLLLGGGFLLLANNLAGGLGQWRGEAKVVVYLAPDALEGHRDELMELAAGAAWVTGVEAVSEEEARRRFVEIFPSVAELLGELDDRPLPASLEIAVEPGASAAVGYEDWTTRLSGHPGVTGLDDDRVWLDRLETVLVLLRSVGLLVGAVLLGAAVFTAASVIRLTAFIYRDEIGVMRQVGATERYIRGPFYVQGALEGLLGSALALLALYAAFRWLAPPEAADPLLQSFILGEFLPVGQQAMLLAIGALAGLLGALVSLRRESFSDSVET